MRDAHQYTSETNSPNKESVLNAQDATVEKYKIGEEELTVGNFIVFIKTELTEEKPEAQAWVLRVEDSAQTHARGIHHSLAYLDAELNYKKNEASIQIVASVPVGFHGLVSSTERILALEALLYAFELSIKNKGITSIEGTTNKSLARLAQKKWGFQKVQRTRTLFHKIVGVVELRKDITKNTLSLEKTLERQKKILARQKRIIPDNGSQSTDTPSSRSA